MASLATSIAPAKSVGITTRALSDGFGLEVIGVDLSRPLVIFTQHSVTTEFDQARAQLLPSLAALEKLAAEGVQIVVTYPNNDAGGRAIIAELEQRRRHLREQLGTG